jgi:hypothetical protein
MTIYLCRIVQMAPALSPTLSRLVACHVHVHARLPSAANDEGPSGQAGSDTTAHLVRPRLDDLLRLCCANHGVDGGWWMDGGSGLGPV